MLQVALDLLMLPRTRERWAALSVVEWVVVLSEVKTASLVPRASRMVHLEALVPEPLQEAWQDRVLRHVQLEVKLVLDHL